MFNKTLGFIALSFAVGVFVDEGALAELFSGTRGVQVGPQGGPAAEPPAPISLPRSPSPRLALLETP